MAAGLTYADGSTPDPCEGVVKYGKTPELGREQIDRRVGRRHAVAIADLEPGSTYHYRVEDVGRPRLTGSFRTAPAGEGSNFSFAVVGDSGRRLYPAGKGRLTACSRSTHHAVLGSVDGGRVSLEAVEPDGTVFDRFDSIVNGE